MTEESCTPAQQAVALGMYGQVVPLLELTAGIVTMKRRGKEEFGGLSF